MNWTVKDIIDICEGKLYSGNLEIECINFSKDTRTIKEGDVYIGIKGDNFDGNSFYLDAFNNGASVAILEESFTSQIKKTDKTIIIVKDSIKALKDIAVAKLKNVNPKVIAVTGSVGKTSTRDIIYSIVSQNYKTLVTEKNYNNHIGLPLTILRLQDEEVLVLEMGMNNLGEIKYLSEIAKPDVAVITNVQPVHIENLGSIENILKAKLEIISGLKPEGKLIINNDDDYLSKIHLPDIKIIRCSLNDNNSTYKAFDIVDDNYKVKINAKDFFFVNHIKTKPYILNGLLGIATGISLEIPIKQIQRGLENYKLTDDRLEKTISKNNVTIINDSYNASTESMKNAIEYLIKEASNRSIAILGDINELGTHAETLHREVGQYISLNKIDHLITIGNNSKYINDEAMINNKVHFKTKDEAKVYLKEFLKPADTVLIKASNGHKFIEIVNYIKENC